MNTQAHLIIGTAVFAKPDSWKINTAAIVGSLAPDISLYVLVIYYIFLQDVSPSIVFGQMYFSDQWQSIFAVDNSFFVWGIIIGIGFYLKNSIIKIFGLAGFLHLILDFPLHHDDGRAHFWPISDWIFSSPISYWDDGHYGNIIGPLEAILSIILCGILLMRFRTLRARIMILLLGFLEVFPIFANVYGRLFN